eukprot:m.68858 g.68858  ORF g.68858 m.68858 type:complete len:143 (-) comp19933_c0_seq1:92-520(-)
MQAISEAPNFNRKLTSDSMSSFFCTFALSLNISKLAIINSDCWDVPALRRSAMMPLLVLLKISSTSVLSKVIRARGKVPHKVLSLQIQAADKLNSLSEDLFDLVLTQSKLDQSCYELTAYVGAYLAEALMKPKLDPELKEHQ